ncbi:uncharacterized protein LOC134346457 [Mobula hypostoma]|uniref:uncharacterized protein LOC134346457 n=1 Tax=Mobula hypostoma TaxID=723540 RepID=UPI002FC31ED4
MVTTEPKNEHRALTVWGLGQVVTASILARHPGAHSPRGFLPLTFPPEVALFTLVIADDTSRSPSHGNPATDNPLRSASPGGRCTMLREEVVWALLFLSGVAGVRVTITQTPPRVTVTEGGSVQLNCSFWWNLGQEENKPLYSIDWYKDEESALLCNKTAAYNGRLLKSYTEGFLSERASITILDLKLNETGKYYCKIQTLNAETATGTGTEITVKQHEDSIQKNVYLPELFALPAVVLTLALVVVIYILRRCRSPDKRSGSQVVSREVVQSQAVLHTQLNSRKVERLHPPDQIDHKSVMPGIRHEEPGVTGLASLAKSDEGGVVYSALRFQDHCKQHLPSEPVKTPGTKEEWIVYAAVSVRQL